MKLLGDEIAVHCWLLVPSVLLFMQQNQVIKYFSISLLQLCCRSKNNLHDDVFLCLSPFALAIKLISANISLETLINIWKSMETSWTERSYPLHQESHQALIGCGYQQLEQVTVVCSVCVLDSVHWKLGPKLYRS